MLFQILRHLLDRVFVLDKMRSSNDGRDDYCYKTEQPTLRVSVPPIPIVDLFSTQNLKLLPLA